MLWRMKIAPALFGLALALASNCASAAVTQVTETGGVKVLGFGEGAITAWYLSRIAIATVSVPYTNTVDAATFAQAPRRNFIDDLVLEKLQALNLPPSPRGADTEFIRRAFLDTIGTLPTAAEVRSFLAECGKERSDGVMENGSDGEWE